MTHEEAVLLLPEFLQGRLTQGEREEVSAHRDECGECQALAEVYGVISADLQHAQLAGPGSSLAGIGAHPASDLIVSQAVDPGGLDPERTAAVASHLRECSTCSREVEVTRAAHRATRSRLKVLPGIFFEAVLSAGGQNLRAGLAAAVVLLILGYPAYLGLVHLPRLVKEVESLRTGGGEAGAAARELPSPPEGAREIAIWSGPIALNVLDSPERGGESKTLRVAPDQPFLLIGVVAPLPSTAASTDLYRLAIETGGGVVAWSSDISASRIREIQRSSGLVTFSVPASLLVPGPHRLLFSRLSAPGAGALLVVPFEISGGG